MTNRAQYHIFFVVLVFVILAATLSPILMFADTQSYLDRCNDISGNVAHRSLGYALLLFVLTSCGNFGFSALYVAQIIVYILTAYAVFHSYSNAPASNTFEKLYFLTCILILIIHPSVLTWAYAALTEVWVIFCAVFSIFIINNVKFRNRMSYIIILNLMVAFLIVLRDSNFPFIAFSIGLLWYNKDNRHRIIVCSILFLMCIGIAIYNYFEADLYLRWLVPFFNNMGKRILTDTEAVRYFVENGMPISDTLLSLTDTWSWGFMYDEQHTNLRLWHVLGSPIGESFTSWVTDFGKSTYTMYLLEQLPVSLFESTWSWLFFRPLDGYAAQNILISVLYKAFADFFVLLSNLLVATFVGYLLLNIKRVVAIIGLGHLLQLMVISAVGFISYHGDAMEVDRHVVLPAIMWYLLLLDLTYKTFCNKATL